MNARRRSQCWGKQRYGTRALALQGRAEWAERKQRDALLAANDPAYVLADVAAKQKLVAYWSLAFTNPADTQFAGGEWDKVRRAGLWTLKLLALPFKDHPDWQEDWNV